MNGQRDHTELMLAEWAARAARMDRPCIGRFLTGTQFDLARGAAKKAGVQASFDGGWAEAERMQVCFHSPADDPVFTFGWLRISWDSRFSGVEHRSLLGSLMALGIDRSWLGDLIVDAAAPGQAWLTAIPPVTERLRLEWTEAGRVPIRCEMAEQAPSPAAPEGSRIRVTVSSLRLDCVLAEGLNLSRARAQDCIRRGLVQVSHQEELRPDRLLSPGTVVSVRGKGRVRLLEAGEATKKGRIPVTLELWIHSH